MPSRRRFFTPEILLHRPDSDLPGLEVRLAAYRQTAFAKHIHETASVGLVLPGVTRFGLDRESLPLAAGDLACIGPGRTHAYQNHLRVEAAKTFLAKGMPAGYGSSVAGWPDACDLTVTFLQLAWGAVLFLPAGIWETARHGRSGRSPRGTGTRAALTVLASCAAFICYTFVLGKMSPTRAPLWLMPYRW